MTATAPHMTQSKKDIALLEKDDTQMVTGIYRNVETPGGSTAIVWRKWPSEPVKTYKLKDGVMATIPKGLARHLNKNFCYWQHSRILAKDGTPDINRQGVRIDRGIFDSMQFYDDRF